MEDTQERIGLRNTDGHTVLTIRPRQIRLIDTGDVLDLHTGQSYRILLGAKRGDVVKPGDYVGQGTHVGEMWLLRNPTKWERTG